MKIVLFCGDSNTVINFRKELILFLLTKNHKIIVITSDNERKDEIISLGVEHRCLKFSNRSKNLFQLYEAKKRATKIIKEIAPDIMFSFQLKPNIIACSVAKKINFKKTYCMVEGLGDPFQPHNFKGKLIRFVVSNLYKNAFKTAKKVFFLNSDDLKEFVGRKIISKEKSIVIPGIGIDTDKFQSNPNIIKPNKVIMLSRLIKNKGILDYCEIANKVKKNRPDIIFELYGKESEIKQKDIQKYIDNKLIYYGGYSNKIIDLFENSKIYVSTSFREGFPRTILEAMSLGIPVIATDVVGNKEAVVDGVTGYLVPKSDNETFANKIIEIIDSSDLYKKFSYNSRKICVEKFDSKIINALIYKQLDLND